MLIGDGGTPLRYHHTAVSYHPALCRFVASLGGTAVADEHGGEEHVIGHLLDRVDHENGHWQHVIRQYRPPDHDSVVWRPSCRSSLAARYPYKNRTTRLY
eukprot:844702-Rhodomonas_salina.1